jgi:hypothetical protein
MDRMSFLLFHGHNLQKSLASGQDGLNDVSKSVQAVP